MTNSREGTQKKLESLRKAYRQSLPEKIREAEEDWSRLAGDLSRLDAFTGLHRKIHTISGSSATFGFTSLSTTAREFEKMLKSVMEGDIVFHEPEKLRERISTYMAQLKRVSAEEPDVRTSAPHHDHHMPPPQAVSSFREKKVIFLIEDDPFQLESLAIQISHFGYTVRTFTKLEDLRKGITDAVPSAIMMDIMFPEGNLAGTRAVAEIQKTRDTPLPVIFISSRNDLDARLQAVRAGGDAYFMKPVHIIDVIDKLDILTTHKQPEPYRILIVEDEPELADYFSSVMEDSGMKTMIVNDPMQVLDPLIEFNPDLILMDMYMPGCNGHELAKTIRQMEAYFSIPIVFLSAETNIDKQLTAMRMGGDDFLTKPIQPEHLISSVAIRAERMRIMRSFMEQDGLTGLLNHTKTKEQLELAVARTVRQQGKLAFAMIDIDRFKSVNDTFGHSTGDRVIVALSRLLQQRLRKTDVIGRYGGEEFAIILIDTDIKSAEEILDEIRLSFSQIKHQSEERQFTVTFSCGLADFPRYRDAVGLNDAADKALYKAKDEGRNRVVVMEE